MRTLYWKWVMRGSIALLLSCLLQCTSEEGGLRPSSVQGAWLRPDSHAELTLGTAHRLQAAARRTARQGAEEGEGSLLCKRRCLHAETLGLTGSDLPAVRSRGGP